MANRMRQAFLSFPEVSDVVSQLGRPDNGTETTGFFNVEFSVDLWSVNGAVHQSPLYHRKVRKWHNAEAPRCPLFALLSGA